MLKNLRFLTFRRESRAGVYKVIALRGVFCFFVKVYKTGTVYWGYGRESGPTAEKRAAHCARVSL